MKKYFVALAAALLLTACASSTKGGLVGANRAQMFLVSEAQMNQSAALAYTQTLKQASSKRTLNTDPIKTKRVKSIADRLIAQVGTFRDDALKWDWQVNVIKDDTVNAWCMPGGKIAVYTGIIDKLSLTDDELAAVMGHEIAHALREHSREQASTDQLKNVGIFAVGLATGSSEIANLASLATQYTITLPFSRSHETEADTIGTELMARAGYNPNSAVNVWRKMQQKSGSSVPEILSTHPSHESRIKNLQKVAQQVMPLYQSAQTTKAATAPKKGKGKKRA